MFFATCLKWYMRDIQPFLTVLFYFRIVKEGKIGFMKPLFKKTGTVSIPEVIISN